MRSVYVPKENRGPLISSNELIFSICGFFAFMALVGLNLMDPRWASIGALACVMPAIRHGMRRLNNAIEPYFPAGRIRSFLFKARGEGKSSRSP